ncbi:MULTISPECIES: MucR family transcriptional regulator [Rhizobium]|uniref:MucR family transcriptional regulator n=1 Tax=Rhizobium TaxID=379 RepID=UPI00026EE864|nr:putative transcriptional regulator [Rhizobium sp. AP16]
MDGYTDMKNTPKSEADPLLDGCVAIVSAFLSRNSVYANTVPRLIEDVYTTLFSLSSNTVALRQNGQSPAADLGASLTGDYIVCLEDGKKVKLLKRYLRTHFGLTPDEYRAKWGLASDYPMVAPNYANRRSELAKLSGFGENTRQPGGRRRLAKA